MIPTGQIKEETKDDAPQDSKEIIFKINKKIQIENTK